MITFIWIFENIWRNYHRMRISNHVRYLFIIQHNYIVWKFQLQNHFISCIARVPWRRCTRNDSASQSKFDCQKINVHNNSTAIYIGKRADSPSNDLLVQIEKVVGTKKLWNYFDYPHQWWVSTSEIVTHNVLNVLSNILSDFNLQNSKLPFSTSVLHKSNCIFHWDIAQWIYHQRSPKGKNCSSLRCHRVFANFFAQ